MSNETHNRIEEYLSKEDEFQNWKNTVITYFIHGYEKPLIFTPFLDEQCQNMFDDNVLPLHAAIWIGDYLGMNKK